MIVTRLLASSASGVSHRFVANGAFRVDTDVDGAFIARTALTLVSVKLHRRVAGTTGSTVIDVKKNGVSVLSTLASVTAASGNNAVSTNAVISVPSIGIGDRLTVDCTAVEGGTPRDFTVIIEGT